jgi:hypothetical protein
VTQNAPEDWRLALMLKGGWIILESVFIRMETESLRRASAAAAPLIRNLEGRKRFQAMDRRPEESDEVSVSNVAGALSK